MCAEDEIGNKDSSPVLIYNFHVLVSLYVYLHDYRQYQDVPWDNMLAPKQWAPTTTLEPKPDQVDQRYQIKRYVPCAQAHQLLGPSWDNFQTRNGYYKNPQWIDL